MSELRVISSWQLVNNARKVEKLAKLHKPLCVECRKLHANRIKVVSLIEPTSMHTDRQTYKPTNDSKLQSRMLLSHLLFEHLRQEIHLHESHSLPDYLRSDDSEAGAERVSSNGNFYCPINHQWLSQHGSQQWKSERKSRREICAMMHEINVGNLFKRLSAAAS